MGRRGSGFYGDTDDGVTGDGEVDDGTVDDGTADDGEVDGGTVDGGTVDGGLAGAEEPGPGGLWAGDGVEGGATAGVVGREASGP